MGNTEQTSIKAGDKNSIVINYAHNYTYNLIFSKKVGWHTCLGILLHINCYNTINVS